MDDGGQSGHRCPGSTFMQARARASSSPASNAHMTKLHLSALRSQSLREALSVAEPPTWERSRARSVEQWKAAFAHSQALTVGAEEELMLVDETSFDLVPAGSEALESLRHDRRFSEELGAAQLEIVTRVCMTAADVRRELCHARLELARTLDDRHRLLAAGAHPFAQGRAAVVERAHYQRIANEYRFATARIACGLHVHVAVSSAACALAVYNSLRSYLPELTALAANSPYCEGEDTGLASTRSQLNERFPRSGIPPVFASWDDLVRYVEWGRRGGLFPDASHFWWDLRLNPDHGTIEARVADTQTSIDEAAALVGVVQALVAWLSERYLAGEALPVHATHLISENAWRAQRYGIRGRLVDLDSGRRMATRERLTQLLDQLEPYAADLAAEHELRQARVLLAGNGSERQRYIERQAGVRELTRWLVQETEGCCIE
jgi:glutamate---cysteine ligase / carboxylate-amine ligase